MYQTLRLTISAITVALVVFPTSAPAQVAAQIMLTQKQVEGFIAVQKDMSDVLQKMQETGFLDPANAKYKAQLKAVARKRGFKNFVEYQAVAANISILVTSIDPQTKEFTDPQSVIENELESVKADQTIADNEKKRLLAELNAALRTAQSIQYPTNIELVKKYYDQIDMTTTAAPYDGEGRPISSAVRTISE
jgi:hypothetical protein